MSNSSKLMLAARNRKGQISYLSEGYDIPEFFNLIMNSKKETYILPDFSPIINILFELHKNKYEESIMNHYKTIVNYWKDSLSFSNENIKIQKAEFLAKESNNFLVSIEKKIEELFNEIRKYYNMEQYDYNTRNNAEKVLNDIKNTTDMYIDILLCYIHSKASLEIESFRFDTLLEEYCRFLKDNLFSLFYYFIDYRNSSLDPSSLLFYLAFREDEDLQHYCSLINSSYDSHNLKIMLFNKTAPEIIRDFDFYDNSFIIKTEIIKPKDLILSISSMLMKQCHKIDSLSKLLKRLKENNIEWSDDKSTIEELIKKLR